jgi:hypothetical protein
VCRPACEAWYDRVRERADVLGGGLDPRQPSLEETGPSLWPCHHDRAVHGADVAGQGAQLPSQAGRRPVDVDQRQDVFLGGHVDAALHASRPASRGGTADDLATMR